MTVRHARRDRCMSCLFRSVLFVAALPCLLASCMSTRVEYLGEKRYTALAKDAKVSVFDAETDIKRPFVKVARLVTTGAGGFWSSWEDMLSSMKAKAREIGADVLILGSETEQLVSFQGGTQKQKTATAARLASR